MFSLFVVEIPSGIHILLYNWPKMPVVFFSASQPPAASASSAPVARSPPGAAGCARGAPCSDGTWRSPPREWLSAADSLWVNLRGSQNGGKNRERMGKGNEGKTTPKSFLFCYLPKGWRSVAGDCKCFFEIRRPHNL